MNPFKFVWHLVQFFVEVFFAIREERAMNINENWWLTKANRTMEAVYPNEKRNYYACPFFWRAMLEYPLYKLGRDDVGNGMVLVIFILVTIWGYTVASIFTNFYHALAIGLALGAAMVGLMVWTIKSTPAATQTTQAASTSDDTPSEPDNRSDWQRVKDMYLKELPASLVQWFTEFKRANLRKKFVSVMELVGFAFIIAVMTIVFIPLFLLFSWMTRNLCPAIAQTEELASE